MDSLRLDVIFNATARFPQSNAAAYSLSEYLDVELQIKLTKISGTF